jgi:anti-anti-sigma regulatory factor
MSTETAIQAHIAYELIDDHKPDVVVIEFLSPEIASPREARELAAQLESLIRPELPQVFVIDFENVRSFGSTAFGTIVSFARQARRLFVCNTPKNLRLGAALIGLDGYAEFFADRLSAVHEARKAATCDQDDTAEYPTLWSDLNESGDDDSWFS